MHLRTKHSDYRCGMGDRTCPGGGGATVPLESSRAVSVPCHRGPWCPGSCSSPEPVVPPVLVLASAGESGVQEKAGMLPGPEAALGQSWNVGVTPCLQDCYGCAAPPNTCGCTLRPLWWSSPSSWGADDNLRQLTGCEVPVRQLSVHSLAAVTAQATLVPSKLCSHCSVSP